MATADYIISNQSGASFRTDLNNTLAAIVSNNSNSSEPATKYAYQWWADTSAGVMKIRNSANNGWIELFQLDGTLTLEDGSNSAPALAFRDDLDTGIFSGGANEFNIATAGAERFVIEADGDIGLATTSPNATGFGGPVVSIGKSGNPYAVLELQGAITSDGAAAVVVCHNSGGSRLAELQFNRVGANNTGSLDVNVYGAGSAVFVARFNASKQLLLGSTTSRAINTHAGRLQIQGTDYSSQTVEIIANSADVNGAYLFFAKQRSGSVGGNTICQNNDIVGQLRFAYSDGVDLENPAAYIEVRVDGSPSENNTPAKISFYTNDGSTGPEERIVIEHEGALAFIGAQTRAGNTNSICSSGNNAIDINITEYFYLRHGNGTEIIRARNNGRVFIGTTSGNGILNVSGNASTNETLILDDTNNTNAHTHRISFKTGSTEVGKITSNRSATLYVTSSDYRLKENVVNITDGISRLKKLLPKRFNWINDESNTLVDGFLAHEVSDAVPEAISGTKDEVDSDNNPVYQGIDQSRLVPLLVAAVKELITKVETLEAA